MAVVPRRDLVLLQRVAAESKSAGGIILPDAAQEQRFEAQVVRVGPDVQNLDEGATVIVGMYHGTEIKVAGEEFILIPDESILAVIE